ncbi:glycosyltransferase [Candidatus Endoriftia persephone]|jgi:glycosyltransferase involved in cell wall biosynthesis|uniref:Glycosyl transferase family 2 n=3 Tax=Gammaproteobacteria TaxID=1236 RepID=G2FD01_9GAMM|nr:glycosyltransferase [Candidatus Endoriftia persephone]EGV50715.1 glycosyl transferase, family 2 [endosymbiont of Riftia pachyptila (vent Ph05)]EGW55381.1 glycosyl transferase family 2 [endosymbiont of Tevnia jerichonana (vent Tica)]USF88891.1 glycosyltransferase [Candidatus Endoriftia persephone]
MGPRVSVLLPLRNAAATLDECITSIQSQSLQDFELLAINDGSSDQTLAILERYADRDQRLRILSNPGKGLVDALNYGLAQAGSPLIARIDGDDRMHTERLSRQLAFLQQNPNVTLVASQARIFPEEQLQAGFREYIRWQNRCLSAAEIAHNIYIESPFPHPSVTFRRTPIIQIGGYRQGPFPEDYDLWLRLHQAGHRMEKLPHKLLDWRESPGRVSRTDPRCSREAFDSLRARYLAKEPRLLERRHDLVVWGAGRKTRKRCRYLLDYGFKVNAWIDIDPRKIGNRIDNAPVVDPEWLNQKKRPFVLVYVNNHGARELIGEQLSSFGYRVEKDFLMVG